MKHDPKKFNDMGLYQLDDLDRKILRLIINDARKAFLEVARECNVSGAAIQQRVQKMMNAGVIIGSEFIINNNQIGYETCAYIGLYLQAPGQFPAVMDALGKISEVVECHYTTGKYDLFIKIYAKNNLHLLHIIHHQLQPIGLTRMETLISFKEGFKRNLPFNDIEQEIEE